MVEIPYVRDLAFAYGRVDRVSPLIRRIIARNPSPFTFYGTGVYMVGTGDVAVIDPGPAEVTHIQALAAALQGERISHILVTHTHNDHSPGVPLLQQLHPAPSYGYGPHGQGKIEAGIQIEEGGDMEFEPDVRVRHGDLLSGKDWTLEAVYTPGHTSNHVCYRLREESALFSGDHVMGWSTSVISPPDGDMTQYMSSLEALLDANDEIYWPTHGPPIRDPKPYVRALIEHRHEREEQILAAIGQGRSRIQEMVPGMYANVPRRLHPAAAHSVYAAVLHLLTQGRIECAGEATMDTDYRLPVTMATGR